MKEGFRITFPVLATAALVVAWILISSFFEIIDEIWVEQRLLPIDGLLSAWIQDQSVSGSVALQIMTWLGNFYTLMVVSLVLSGWLAWRGLRREAVLLTGGFLLTSALVGGLKILTGRIRPPHDPGLAEIFGAFPSGHAAMSTMVYVFLAVLIARRLNSPWQRVVVLVLGLSLAVAIGISRLILNVHWLSDVLAGLALGGAVVSLMVALLGFSRPGAQGRLEISLSVGRRP